MEEVKQPVAPGGATIIYQVTLASGAIATNPYAFGSDADQPIAEQITIVTEDGRILSDHPPVAPERPSEEFQRFDQLARRLLSVPKSEIDAGRQDSR